MTLETKYKHGDILYALLSDKIIQGRVVGITKSDFDPLVKGSVNEESYTLKTSTGMWTRTNNVNDIYDSVDELKLNIKVIKLND